jgi:hypothetical protein
VQIIQGITLQSKPHTFPERTFHFWERRTAHNELLIRSPRESSQPDNVDVMFWSVAYLSIPWTLKALEILPPTDEDVDEIRSRFGASNHERMIVVLRSRTERHYVVARNVNVCFNSLEPNESPFDYKPFGLIAPDS